MSEDLIKESSSNLNLLLDYDKEIFQYNIAKKTKLCRVISCQTSNY